MHYTEGQDYVDIGGGVREFIDQSLPGTPGTVDPAEFSNAVQYEIINCILYAGLTVETTAANDRSAGWIQLREAIFNSAAIDTAALANGAVTNVKIDNGAVTDTKVSSVSLNKLSLGTADITGGTDRIILSNTQVQMQDTATGAYSILASGTGVTNAFLYSKSAASRIMRISDNGYGALDVAGTSYQLETIVNGEGITYSGGPGASSAASKRTDGFIATSLSWSIDSGTARIYYTVTDLTLTGIPWGSTIYNVRLEFIDTSGKRVNAPLSSNFKDVAGVTTLDSASYLGGTTPTGGTSHILWITYNSALVD